MSKLFLPFGSLPPAEAILQNKMSTSQKTRDCLRVDAEL